MAGFSYHEPATIDAAVEILGQHDGEAKVVAGGQSLMILLAEGLAQPRALVALQGIQSLNEVSVDGGQLVIGANATHQRVHTHPAVVEHWPLLARVVGSVATLQVRNRGTVCGSVAHGFPLSDPPAGLLALDASARVAGPGGERVVPLAGFFLGFLTTDLSPDEVLTHLLVPGVPPRTGTAYRALRARPLDFPVASVAARLSLREDGSCAVARLALTGAGPVPLRALSAEAVLEGQAITPDLIAEAARMVAASAEPAADIDGSEAHKRRVLGVLARRAIAEALGQASA